MLEEIIELPKCLIGICESYLDIHDVLYYKNQFKDFNNYYFWYEAAKYGWVDVFIWRDKEGYGYDTNYTCRVAARYGQINILKYAIQNGYQLNNDIISAAALYDQLEIIKWAKGYK